MWGTYKELKSVIEKFDINLENSDISGLIHTVNKLDFPTLYIFTYHNMFMCLHCINVATWYPTQVVTPVLLGIPITGDALGFWTVRFFQKMEVWMPNLWNGWWFCCHHFYFQVKYAFILCYVLVNVFLSVIISFVSEHNEYFLRWEFSYLLACPLFLAERFTVGTYVHLPSLPGSSVAWSVLNTESSCCIIWKFFYRENLAVSAGKEHPV